MLIFGAYRQAFNKSVLLGTTPVEAEQHQQPVVQRLAGSNGVLGNGNLNGKSCCGGD